MGKKFHTPMHLFLHSPIRSNTILHYSLNSHMNLNNRQVAIRKKIIDSDFLLHEQMKQTQLLRKPSMNHMILNLEQVEQLRNFSNPNFKFDSQLQNDFVTHQKPVAECSLALIIFSIHQKSNLTYNCEQRDEYLVQSLST